MFLQLSVILLTGGHAWWREASVANGGVHGEGGHAWWRGGMHGKEGMRGERGHVWWKGACVAKGEHSWQRGVCMAKGSMHGKGGMGGEGGAYMHGEGEGRAWYARPLRDMAGQCRYAFYWNAFLLSVILMQENLLVVTEPCECKFNCSEKSRKKCQAETYHLGWKIVCVGESRRGASRPITYISIQFLAKILQNKNAFQ